MYKILDNISSPADIKKLSGEQLVTLCSEVRDYIIRCCAENPGHLGASLGAVELIVGLHRVFDTPDDILVFDVGHQAYAHKILTGRREAFRQNRKKDGISGFLNRDESPYDAFGAGHASTSISAALGFAEAARLKGENKKVVAVIGDGAMTGGLAYEGLNNAGITKADILIILNDNDQSIDGNLGAVHDYLLKLTTSGKYNRMKTHIWDCLGEGRLRTWFQKITRNTKSSLVSKSGGALFEALGFRYFGPINGNDIYQVTDTLSRLKSLPGPRILHIHTVKGKGYAPAEKDPALWHSPGKFNVETGDRLSAEGAVPRWQDVFGDTLCSLAEADKDVVGITPAMASGCGMTKFAKLFPERFYDVGIEEEHAVTFSAGLAAGGLKPFCNIYSTFAQRAYDQIIHDVAMQKLPVVLCFDRGGLVGEDGQTHQGVYDLAAYRSIPRTVICSPRDEVSLKQMMYSGLRHKEGPYIIRYPRGCAEGVPYKDIPFKEIADGKGEILRRGEKVAVIALGNCVCRALEAADDILAGFGVAPTVADMRFLKPLDEEMVLSLAAGHEAILTVEDGCLKGGLFGAVTELLASKGVCCKVKGLGVPDKFITQDSQSSQRAACGIDRKGIASAASQFFQKSFGE